MFFLLDNNYMDYNYLVSVLCCTFNQSAYIKDALNGFVMQQTNFPFVVLVVDDASTDGEQEEIRKFMAEEFDLSDTSVAYEKETEFAYIQYAQHKTNKNCFMVAMFLKENHYSIKKPKYPYLVEWRDGVKYEAICEGDDYWIDPLKLQKQVDFLEMNPEYSMCFHSAKIINELGIADKISGVVEEREYTANEVFKQWTAPTASLLFKREIYDLPMNDRYKPLYGDIVMILRAAKCGKLRGMSEPMSIYRVHSGGVTYDKARRKGFAKRLPEHFLYIRDNFGEMLDSKDVRLVLAASLRVRLFHYPFRIFTSYDMILAFFYDPKYLFRKFLKCLQICFVMNLLVLEVL